MQGSPRIVSDVMSHTVVAVGRKAPIKDIVDIMSQWEIGALPVLEGEGRVVGIVSEADLRPNEVFPASPTVRSTRLDRSPDSSGARGLTAENVMTTPAVTVHADATITEAIHIMAERRVKRLPVVDGEGMLEGLVSRWDLLRVFLRADDDIAEEIRREVVPYLFDTPVDPIDVRVADGRVVLTGRVRDSSLVCVAVRMVRAIDGVVDIESHLTDSAS
ncbi:CBS domain-containing protein [Streptomyces sp. NPDC051133]|uniref:CBS domain-containing protein n=1 Tax=Streptomyces sp. NPDC051133 TaxID=3155521 RepID=UPI003439F468